ncbi:hypothetical protein D5018_15165 [Parashewanella curva]|uniref:Uncharacterized protein n=1 Tax=Parashewanella curva TaxID=2338552 RepID=A0A3L8PTX8_9GAMM|nr:hypothetical protein [Parashewanella curva]RLV58841.1 hypothetical protein D5018_15165 [Parashewanella curva]
MAYPAAPCLFPPQESWEQPTTPAIHSQYGQYAQTHVGASHPAQTNFHSTQEMSEPKGTCLYFMSFEKENINIEQLREFLTSIVDKITVKQLNNFVAQLGISAKAQLQNVLDGTFCNNIKNCTDKEQYKIVLKNAVNLWVNTPSLGLEQLGCALNSLPETAFSKPYYLISPFVSLPEHSSAQPSNLLAQIHQLSTENQQLSATNQQHVENAWQWENLTKSKDAEIVALQTELSQLKQQLHEFHTRAISQTPMTSSVNGLTKSLAKVAITTTSTGATVPITVATGDHYNAQQITIIKGDQNNVGASNALSAPAKPKYSAPELKALQSKPREDIVKEMLYRGGNRVVRQQFFHWAAKDYKTLADKLKISNFRFQANHNEMSQSNYYLQIDRDNLAKLCCQKKGFTYKDLLVAIVEITGDLLNMDELTDRLLNILKRHGLVAFDRDQITW